MRAHHGGVWRREHVRGRGATIVGTSGDLPSPASEKGRKKGAKPRGNSVIMYSAELALALIEGKGAKSIFNID